MFYMSLKNQKGIVRYQGRDDIVCSYGIRDDGKQFYYLDVNNGDAFKNGNRVATTALVEAVDPMVKASNIGLIDSEGKEIIPFTNRSIRAVNDDIILVEPATPVTQSVIDAIELKSDPLSATKLVSTPALIKEKLNAKVGSDGRYLFNDQFSEATVCDINGNNLVNDERYSFIVSNGKELFFSKNTADSEITNYSILPPEVQSDVTPTNDDQVIDVSEVDVPKDIVEDALNVVSQEAEVEKVDEEKTEEVQVPDTEKVGAPEMDSKVEVEAPDENVVQEDLVKDESAHLDSDQQENESGVSVEEDNVNAENGFAIPMVSVDIPTIPETVFPSAMNSTDTMPDITEDYVQNTAVKEAEEVAVPDTVLEDNVVEDDNVVEEPSVEEEDVLMSSVVPDKIEDATDDLIEEEPVMENNVSFDKVEEVASPIDIVDQDNSDFDIDDEIVSDSDDDIKIDSVDEVDADDDLFSETVGDVEYKEPVESSDDNIMSDVAKSMTAMMNRIKALEAELSEEQAKTGKLSASRRTLIEKNKMLGKKVEILTDKNTSLGATIAKANSTNNVLENRVHEQKRVIDAQSQELQMLRPLLQYKEKVVGILADVQALLDDGTPSKVR